MKISLKTLVIIGCSIIAVTKTINGGLGLYMIYRYPDQTVFGYSSCMLELGIGLLFLAFVMHNVWPKPKKGPKDEPPIY